jgi:Mg-chelatase subunit ChlD
MGRHRTALDGGSGWRRGRLTGRHRHGRGTGTPALVIPVVMLVLAAGTATAVAAVKGVFGCLGSGTDLRVTAAPDVAPALDTIARRLREGGIGGTDDCVDVTVTAREPYQVAETLRAARSDSVDAGLPHVWVPDSSLWLDRARDDRPDAVRLAASGSVAHSPLVIAMARPLADRLRWQEAKLSWVELLAAAAGRTGSGTALRFGIVDPARSGPATAGLAGIRNGTAKASSPLVLAGAVRGLAANVAPTERSLVDQLPRNPAELADPAIERLHAFPQSEQGVWRYNTGNPDALPLAAVYPADGAPELDYPYVRVLAGDDRKDGELREAAEAFGKAIGSRAGRQALQAQAFRTADGAAGLALSPVNGTRQQRPPGPYQLQPADVEQAERVWAGFNLNARMLAVIDVSGSMAKVDPGTSGSRMSLTRDGAAQGLGLLADPAELGLWVFSTRMTPTTDYQQIIDVGRLGEQIGSATRRDLVLARLGGLTAKAGGATGLYDTALAAYRKMLRDYNPKALNSVVLFTDGKNEDPGSISLEALVAELRRLRDPQKPVVIYTIGFGNEVDVDALQTIAEATGGASTVTTDPLRIQETFMNAVARRLVNPS